jgi:AAA15 family ATPase/GTPase
MIINFSVKNFRSIKDWVTLSFEAVSSSNLEDYYISKPKEGMRLLKLGIIYGANASGKTNILLALDYLRNLVLEPFDKKSERFDFTPFLFDSESKDKNTAFSLEFIQNGVKYLYEIELNKEAVIKESLYFHKPNRALVYQHTTDIQKQIAKITFGSKIKISKEGKDALIGNTLWNNTVLGGYLKTNFESVELQEIIDWFANRLSPIIQPKSDLSGFVFGKIERDEIKKENIIEILKKADFGVSDIVIKNKKVKIDKATIDFILKSSELSKNEIDEIKSTGEIEALEILLQHLICGSKYLLSIEDESAGTKRYFGLSGILSFIIKQNKILSIDELESSLHPDLIKHFILTFLVNSKNSQIITTTHHRELLMEKDILRNDVIWFTDKKKDSSTDLFSLADFDSSVIRNTSSIYNAYKTGKLGAVPNLSDYYIDFENEKK